MATKTQLGKLLIARDDRQTQINKLTIAARKLENEISQLDTQIFIAEHDLSPQWEKVPREEWEHLKVGEEAAVAIKRPKNDESWSDEGIVDSWGQWSRGILCGFTHFSMVNGVGNPIEPTRGITVEIWRRND